MTDFHIKIQDIFKNQFSNIFFLLALYKRIPKKPICATKNL